jgi:hypothetical protein
VDLQKSVPNSLFRAEVDAGEFPALDGVEPSTHLIEYPADDLIHKLFRALIRSFHASDGQSDCQSCAAQATADVALASDAPAESRSQWLRTKAVRVHPFLHGHQDRFGTIEAGVEV